MMETYFILYVNVINLSIKVYECIQSIFEH